MSEANKLAISTQQHTDSAIRNAEVIQAMGMMPSIVKSWFKENEKVLKLQCLASDRSSTIQAFSRFLRLGLQMGIMGTGAYYVTQNAITPGTMIAASILMGRALSPVEQAIGTWKQWISARQAYGRLQTPWWMTRTLDRLLKMWRSPSQLSSATMWTRQDDGPRHSSVRQRGWRTH